MADLAASDGAEGAEKLGNDREMSEHACAEAMRGPSLHEGGGDRAGLKEKSTDDGAKSASENQESGMCAGVSSSTPVTVVGQDAQGSSKTIADPFIDSPQPMDTASEDANEGEGVEHSGSGKEKSESDKASPTSDPEKKGAVLSGGVAEESAMHEHAPAVGASCGPCKEESGLGETVVGSVTEHAGPDDETGEDSDRYEDAPAGPDKDNSEGDNAASITNPTREEAEQPELTGNSGPVKYEDPSFDEDDLKGDGAESAVDSIKEEREPASLPTDDSPLFEDASSSYGPDSDSTAVAQVEKVPVVPVDQTDKVCGTSAGGLGEELEEMPSSSVLSSVAVATSSHKDQVEEGQHVDPSCGPPCHVQAKSWADDEPLVASPELEGGHQAAADDPSPGHPGDVSEGEEEAGEELELQLQPDELDYDSGIVEGGTTGPGEGDEEDEDECIEGERQQGDGEESVDPSDVVDKELDYDEDKRNPQYIPKKGAFYQHDDRMVGDEEAAEVQEEKKEDDKGSQRNKKKLWQDDGVWSHDMFNEDEQTPKSKEEIVATYGYDIRSETMPPRARRRRRYGRGPNKYQRNWEDEDAYSARPGFGRGGGSVRGGHRGRGGGPVGNPSFRDEDFPDLNAKPPSSGSAANQDTGAEHHRSSGGPPSQQDWDHSAGNSGQGRRGWGRRPQAQRRPSDGGSPKRPENELTKEVAPLNHRGGSKPAPRPPLKASEPLLHGAPGKTRAGKHTPTEPERSLRGAELASKPASKMEAKEGGGGAESKNTAVVAPRTGPLGSTETTVKPKRYSSLRQRPIIEAASYTQEPAVVAPQGPLPQPGPDRPQPAILTAAHFQAPYSPYPDGYMLPPPGQAPAGMPPQSQPPAVMAAPGQIPGSFLPGPTGLVSFPPQYPPPYTFPAQYAPPAPAAQAVSHVSGPNIPQTQAQKPPYYHGDIIYYNTQSQQHKQRPTPARRPKAAIPIVPPPDSHGGGAQEVPCEPDGCVSHQSRSDEDLEDRGIVGAGPTVQEGVAGQQAVVEL